MFLFKSHSTNKTSHYFEKESRPEVIDCEICHRSFNQLFLPKHKCKRCHRYVCAACGKQKSLILGIDREKDIPHRICDICHSELKSMETFIMENGMCWCQSSKISAYWLSFAQKSKEKLDFQSHRQLFLKNSEKYSQDYSVIIRDIDEGRTDYMVFNFSMRSMLHRLQTMSKTSVIDARENMKRVLEGLLVKYPQIGYCQGMNYIIAFLLCFANEEETFDLFSDLVDRVLPTKFFQKSEKGTGLLGVLAECHVLKRLLKDSELIANRTDLEKALDFMDLKAPQWLLSLLVNILDFEGSYYLFNLLFEWGFFTQMEKAILLIVKRKFNEFLSFSNDSTRITDSITRDISIKVLQCINDVPVDEQMRNLSYKEYMKTFAEKWNQTDRLTHRQLEKITYFSKEEISLLQTSFLSLIEDRKSHGKKKKNHTTHDEITDKTNLLKCKNENSKENSETIMEKSVDLLKKKEKAIRGITKGDFSVIMGILMSQKEGQVMSKEDLDLMFEAFDEDKSETLDFREFLCCMSILIKGTVNDKLEMTFGLFDKENKGYLKVEEGELMVEYLIKSLRLTLKGENQAIEKEEVEEFRNRLMERIKGKEKVTLIEFAGVENDSFVVEMAKRRAKKYEV